MKRMVNVARENERRVERRQRKKHKENIPFLQYKVSDKEVEEEMSKPLPTEVRRYKNIFKQEWDTVDLHRKHLAHPTERSR